MPVSATSSTTVVAVDERPHRDGPARRRELQRVREQVADELHEPLVIAVDERDRRSTSSSSCDLAGAGERRRRLDDLARDLVDAHRGEVQLQAARIEARHEEEVADQPLQPLRAAVDDREEALLLVGELARLALPDHLEEAHHRGQRRAELVRDGGDEVVLQPVELALLRHLAQGPDAAEEPAAIVANGRGEALERAAADRVLELVERLVVGIRAQPLHRGVVPVAVLDPVLDGEQPVDDGALEAHPELARQVEHRPVRELHVAVGVREQDPVDRRVEHGAQHVREPFEIARSDLPRSCCWRTSDSAILLNDRAS